MSSRTSLNPTRIARRNIFRSDAGTGEIRPDKWPWDGDPLDLDVSKERLDLGLPHRKTAIPALPGELFDALGFNPSWGMALERFDYFRDMLGARKVEEGVNVVGCSADG
jgi:hypothetical protein